MAETLVKPNRRDILKGTTLGGLFLIFGCRDGVFAATTSTDAVGLPLNGFIRVAPDGTVTVFSKYLEMGQGTHTGVATLVADELDADWARMRIEDAPHDPDKYVNHVMGMRVTGGSASMADAWTDLRMAGATARAMLVAAAAKRWNVPADSLTVEHGTVAHPASKRSAGFGELAADAARQPVPTGVTPKTPDQYRLIGKSSTRIDARAKSGGGAQFAGDIRLPGMKVAVVARPPLFGAKLKSVDDSAARKIPGVLDVLTIPQGVAVVAGDFWTAKQAREALDIKWDDGAAETRGSADLFEDYRRLAEQPGELVRKKGDAAAAMKGAAKRVVSVTELPYLAHAPMEPMTCVMQVKGGRCDVWAGTQLPNFDRPNVAKILGIVPEQVHVNTILAGGSFGRRTSLDSEYIAEAAGILAARPQFSPLRLQWSREDDITGGKYRPQFLHRIEGGLDSKGRLVAWHHHLVGQAIYPLKPGIDFTSIEGADEFPYAAPSLIEISSPKVGVPALAWRAVGNTHTAFAIETALDELAFAGGRDPIAFRRELLKDSPQYLGVLDLVEAKSDWGKPLPKGRGRGFAMHKLQGMADLRGPYGSYVAMVAEVTATSPQDVKIDRVVVAIDCGTAINPGVIRDQMEGSIAFGMGAALFGAITLDKGVVQQNNFDGYRIMRMNEMPKVEVYIVPSTAPPRGVGEPGVPPAAPALANAIFAATGQRVRKLPIIKPA